MNDLYKNINNNTSICNTHIFDESLIQIISTIADPPANILVFNLSFANTAHILLDAGYNVAIYETLFSQHEELITTSLKSYDNFLGVLDNLKYQYKIICLFEFKKYIFPEETYIILSRMIDSLAPGGTIIGSISCHEKDDLIAFFRKYNFLHCQILSSKLNDTNIFIASKKYLPDFNAKIKITQCTNTLAYCQSLFQEYLHANPKDELYKSIFTYLSKDTCISNEEKNKLIGEIEHFNELHKRLKRSYKKCTKEYHALLQIYGKLLQIEGDFEYLNTQVSSIGHHNLITLANNAFLARRLANILRWGARFPGYRKGKKALTAVLKRIPGLVFLKRNFFLGAKLYIGRPRVEKCIPPHGLVHKQPPFNAFPPPHPLSEEGKTGLPSICFVNGSLGPGGAERQMANLAVKLHQRGHKVLVRVISLTDTPVDAHYAPILREAGIDLAEIRTNNLGRKGLRMAMRGIDITLMQFSPEDHKAYRLILGLAEELSKTPVDIVHGYLDWTSIIAGWAGLLSATPLIRFSWRNVNPTHFPFYMPWMPSQYQWLIHHPRITLEANAAYAAEDYAKWLCIPKKIIEVSPNGISRDWYQRLPDNARINIRQELNIPAEAPVLISVCRIAKEKRPADMIAVFLNIIKMLPEAHCIHVGIGIDMSPEDVTPPEHDGRIHILGMRKDIPSLLAAADAFLLCSEREGMPNVVLEAMLSGLPVVATKAGGTPELILNGQTGFLADIGDIATLTEKSLLLMSDKELAAKMGALAKKHVQNFTMDALADRTEESYQRNLKVFSETEKRSPASKESFFKLVTKKLAAQRHDGIRTKIIALPYEPPEADTPPFDEFTTPRELSQKAMQGRPKVLLYIGNLGTGGAERQVYRLAKELHRRDCAVKVVSFYTTGARGHFVKPLELEGITVIRHDIDKHRHCDVIKTPLTAAQKKFIAHLGPEVRGYLISLWEELIADPPDVVHCYLDESNIIGAYAGLLAGVPVIRMSARSCNVSNYAWYQPWMKSCYSHVLKYDHVRLEANCLFVADDYKTWLGIDKPISIIPNGIEISQYKFSQERNATRNNLGLDINTPVVLCVMRFSEEKRPLDSIRALKALHEIMPEMRCVMVANGPLEEEACDFIDYLGLGETIVHFPRRYDIPDIMNAADLLLLTSRVEGLSNVIMEAMLFGMPVVATNVGGNPELVIEAQTGYLCEIGDINGMAKAMFKLLTDKKLSQSMGAKAHKRIMDNYTVEKLADNVLAAYLSKAE